MSVFPAGCCHSALLLWPISKIGAIWGFEGGRNLRYRPPPPLHRSPPTSHNGNLDPRPRRRRASAAEAAAADGNEKRVTTRVTLSFRRRRQISRQLQYSRATDTQRETETDLQGSIVCAPRPVARTSREARITQPRTHLLAELRTDGPR